MPAASFGELEQYESTKLLIAPSKTHGSSVRVEQPVGAGVYQYPSYLHLLYIALDGDAQLAVRHLKIDGVTSQNVRQKEKTLFDAGKAHVESGTATNYLESRDFQTIVFEDAAVFTIVIDEINYEFYFPAHDRNDDVIQGETHDPVVFISDKKIITGGSPDGSSLDITVQTFQPNFAFYNAEKTSIRRDATGTSAAMDMDAVRMLNFFTDESGKPIVGKSLRYGFEIFVRAPCATQPGQERRTTIIIDPDGQNQGPPA